MQLDIFDTSKAKTGLLRGSTEMWKRTRAKSIGFTRAATGSLARRSNGPRRPTFSNHSRRKKQGCRAHLRSGKFRFPLFNREREKRVDTIIQVATTKDDVPRTGVFPDPGAKNSRKAVMRGTILAPSFHIFVVDIHWNDRFFFAPLSFLSLCLCLPPAALLSPSPSLFLTLSSHHQNDGNHRRTFSLTGPTAPGSRDTDTTQRPTRSLAHRNRRGRYG